MLNIKVESADTARKPSEGKVDDKDFALLATGAARTARRYGEEFYLRNYDMLFDMVDPERQHTPDHKDCPGCATLAREVTSDLASMSSMTFDEAFLYWSKARKRDVSIRARTHETDREYANALSKFFGNLLMGEINAGNIAMYQQARCANRLCVKGHLKAPWNRMAGSGRVNHELSMLARMLQDCKQWEKIAPNYHPLPTKAWSPRQILTEAAQERLIRLAAGNEEAALAFWVTIISMHTTATGIELRGIRFGDAIVSDDPNVPSTIYIREDSCKNSSRPRKIPLNNEARIAVKMLRARAQRLGATEDEHFLFPYRDKKTRKYDPTTRASRWFLRNSWNALREISGYKDLRPHDFRHVAITKLLEAGVDGDKLNAISGHISARMREYYSHYQLSSKLEALNRIESEYNVQRLVADGRKRFKRQQAREQLKRDALKNVKSRRLQLTERSLASSLLSVSIEPPEAPEPMRAVRDNPA
jgi:integrase